MAKKRMFDRAIIDTDKFMDLSMSSKAIYFLLGMEADDEGFVSYKKVMRVHGGNEDDIKVLAAKNFIIPFQSGVVVITDWNKNNYLDIHRITATEYQKEREMLSLTPTKSYVLNECLTSIEENRREEKSIEENTKTAGDSLFETFWGLYPRKIGKQAALKKWLVVIKKKSEIEIINALKLQLKAKVFSHEQRFIKHPEVWLNKGCWDDEIPKQNVVEYLSPPKVDEYSKEVSLEQREAIKKKMAEIRKSFGNK